MSKLIGVIGGADGPTAIFLAGEIGFDVMYILLVLNLIVPFVMVLVATILKKNPATDMESHNGYNTPTSRKSHAHWDYAQSIAPGIFMRNGKILLGIEIILSLALFVLDIGVNAALVVGNVIGFGFLLYTFWKTEKAVKEKFDNN